MEMIGGLLKTTSLAAIAAAAFAITGSTTPVKAADLGGNCCADLEERVAELEATTVRKGNRKVSVTLSGFVGQQIIWWDDGHQQDMYIGDGGNIFSRFRFVGSAKISPTVTAGFTYEFGNNATAIGSMNQLNGGDGLGGSGQASISQIVAGNTACGFDGSSAGCATIRDSTVWMRHAQLGMIKIGHGSTATDNLVLIDLGGMSSAGTPDTALYVGGFILRGTNGNLGTTSQNWQNAIRGHESWDTNRRDHIMYETPTFAGFSVQTAFAEDNYWDVALRYAGEFAGFRLAFGIGYQEDTKFNAPVQFGAPSGASADLCTTNCDIKSTEVKGSGSILHVPTGLFVTVAAGHRELEGTGSFVNPHDLDMWYLAGGVRKNFFGFGDTVLFGEYQESKGALSQATFLSSAIANPGDSKVTNWGLGINQYVDAAAMEVFVTYKHFELDAQNYIPISDLDVVVAGMRINF
jgi:hypothetical protein